MIRRFKYFFGVDEKPLSPKERIKRQKAEVRKAQAIRSLRLREKEEKKREKAVREGERRSREAKLADDYVQTIVDNCVMAMDLAAESGCSAATVYIRLTHKYTRHFKGRHWKKIVTSLVGYGYDVSHSYSGTLCRFDVTTGVRKISSDLAVTRGPLDGGVPKRNKRIDESDSDSDTSDSDYICHYCSYVVSLKD
jgi:hypothetical protein